MPFYTICCRHDSGGGLCWQRQLSAGLVMVIIIGYGHFRIGRIEELLKKAPRLEVALVQGNIDQNIKWNPHYQSQTIDIYRSLSLQSAPARRRIDRLA